MIDPAELNDLAAEFVLGTLDERERSELEHLRVTDPALDAEIRAWEQRLSPLAEGGAERVPPEELRAAILTRIRSSLNGSRTVPRSTMPGADVIVLRRQMRVWRSATAVVTALAAALALWIARAETLPGAPQPAPYLAVLQQGPDQPSFVVAVDIEHRRMTVVPSAALAEPGKSYELWMIGSDQGAPISLGLLDARSPVHPRLPDDEAAQITRATYAVTLEQAGGSPTGQPTSKPVFAGHLVNSSN